MSKARIKIKLPTITTRVEAEAVMNELSLAENNRRKKIAERDDMVLSVQEDYAAGIEACESAVKEKTDALRAWAEANPDQFAKDRKSIAFAAGTLGFRTGTPALKLLRGWNWQKVTDACCVHLPNFLRSVPEVDKAALIGQREELAAAFPLIGVKINQGESFYVEPLLTDTKATKTVKA